MDVLTQSDIARADPREKPDFQRIRWRVATREGSARGCLGGTGRSGAAATAGPTKAAREVVGSAEGEGPRTTPSLAREE